MATQTKKSFPMEQLVVLVSEHFELYDMTNKLYHNIYHKESIWRTIGGILGHKWEDCRDKWKYLRGKYGKERKEMKERKSGSEGGHKHHWKYVNLLSFLEPHVQERLTVSNFDQPSQTAESILNAMCENNETTLDDTMISQPCPGPGSSNGSSSRPPPHSSRIPPSPSPPPQPPQQQQQQELGPMRVQRGRKRQATATITPYQQQVLSAIAKEENEHERFLLSFAPTLARLEPRKQTLLKCRMQSLFFYIEFGEE
ncbi:uncharacterized protein LOC115552461 [Gadus morhua]|uniref:uncharacterized protein LOC115552461 n=1 Tax=Gadus morhua TaxID=8049 RepID=UPI0011B74742|nr:uncharacterized protein LOC115552461 [Gadus morhua]